VDADKTDRPTIVIPGLSSNISKDSSCQESDFPHYLASGVCDH
jgi:hypothetical protein